MMDGKWTLLIIEYCASYGATGGSAMSLWPNVSAFLPRPALTVSMLPILYGYTVRLISITFSKD